MQHIFKYNYIYTRIEKNSELSSDMEEKVRNYENMEIGAKSILLFAFSTFFDCL
jgi:hypothetical protein